MARVCVCACVCLSVSMRVWVRIITVCFSCLPEGPAARQASGHSEEEVVPAEARGAVRWNCSISNSNNSGTCNSGSIAMLAKWSYCLAPVHDVSECILIPA